MRIAENVPNFELSLCSLHTEEQLSVSKFTLRPYADSINTDLIRSFFLLLSFSLAKVLKCRLAKFHEVPSSSAKVIARKKNGVHNLFGQTVGYGNYYPRLKTKKTPCTNFPSKNSFLANAKDTNGRELAVS